ncbi:NAA60 [Cordylochernes scorpioides]|uniref:N-alpha-acetyltransferase 60 n=1 Tax=Cordylochernes scorpioides TaxID=51811 RepID=A0ABY6L6S3_9ARAC|nr:NAA60 [Cordylochernes scorpioides]
MIIMLDVFTPLCRYPDIWYHDITSSSRFFALAAVHHLQILGLIVAEIRPQTTCNPEDQGLLAPHFTKSTQVAYILTLGVVVQFRRNGIECNWLFSDNASLVYGHQSGIDNCEDVAATLLLDSLISHLTSDSASGCKAIYLHVLTGNTAAIQFYERRNFRLHSYLPFYYSVHGTAQDGFSYVLYINGGHPPWTLLYPLFQHEIVNKVFNKYSQCAYIYISWCHVLLSYLKAMIIMVDS